MNSSNLNSPGTDNAGTVLKTGYGFSPLVLSIISALTLVIGIGIGFIVFKPKHAEITPAATMLLQQYEQLAKNHEAYLKLLDRKYAWNQKFYESLPDDQKNDYILSIADSLLIESRHSGARAERPK
jgi:hypothetical protein